jgi:hypothetical protein
MLRDSKSDEGVYEFKEPKDNIPKMTGKANF